MSHSFEKIFAAAANSKPSATQLKEWEERDAENAKHNSYDHVHPCPTPRSALTGWAGRTLNVEFVQYASEYAEGQGYSDPKAGILFANWNDVSRRVQNILERAGYELEWEDEWTTCSSCGKALRTSPDCYSWQPAYIEQECEILCNECVEPESYLESLEDQSKRALNNTNINPADHGYIKIEGDFENGWYGREDDPAKLLKQLHDEGHHRVLFQVSDVGQFSVGFCAWYKDPDTYAAN